MRVKHCRAELEFTDRPELHNVVLNSWRSMVEMEQRGVPHGYMRRASNLRKYLLGAADALPLGELRNEMLFLYQIIGYRMSEQYVEEVYHG